MRRSTSVKMEHPVDPMIRDDSTANGINSKFISREYFRLFKSSTELDAEPGFKIVENRLLAENESVQAASKTNTLPPLKEKVVTPSGLLPSPQSRSTGSRIE